MIKTTKCRAKYPAFCPYHGIPAPRTAYSFKQEAKECEKKYKKEMQKPNPDFNLARKHVDNQHLARVNAAVAKQETSHLFKTLPDNRTSYAYIKLLQKERQKEINNYLTTLKETLFKNNPTLKKVAEKGLPYNGLDPLRPATSADVNWKKYGITEEEFHNLKLEQNKKEYELFKRYRKALYNITKGGEVHFLAKSFAKDPNEDPDDWTSVIL